MQTYEIQLSMYGSVAERADIKVEANTQEEAEKKALDMAESGEVSFSNDGEATDGWEYQVENAEEII